MPLPSGQQTNLGFHSVLQPHIKARHLLPEKVALFLRQSQRQPAGVGAGVGQRQVFLNGHIRCGALHRVLEHPADQLGTLVFRQKGNVLPVQGNGAAVLHKGAADQVKQGGFAGAVGADNGEEFAPIQVQIDLLQGNVFIDGALGKGLGNILYIKHCGGPPSLLCGSGRCAWQPG